MYFKFCVPADDVADERQTMVFSATLTLDTSKVAWRKGAKKNVAESTLGMQQWSAWPFC